MRLNKYVALSTGISRRAADELIRTGHVLIDGTEGALGHEVADGQEVTLNGVRLKPPQTKTTVMLHKPVGYVCSRDGQGSKTVYNLLPAELHGLKPVGRLDKDSSGLLLMTDDGDLAHKLTHPSFQKEKLYEVRLDKPLSKPDFDKIQTGVYLADGPSQLKLTHDSSLTTHTYRVAMAEGRNRQIRRTFEALGYKVVRLHRTHFGSYALADLPEGKHKLV